MYMFFLGMFVSMRDLNIKVCPIICVPTRYWSRWTMPKQTE